MSHKIGCFITDNILLDQYKTSNTTSAESTDLKLFFVKIINYLNRDQGDQIGRNFSIWATF